MRRLAVPLSALCVALMAAACGSQTHARHRTSSAGFDGAISAAAATVKTLTAAPTASAPTPAQIEHAAALTAAKPGFAARLTAAIRLPQFNGNAVTAVGDGYFDPSSSSGTLEVSVGLPGLLALGGPLPTQVRLVGSEAYVHVPSDVAGELGASDTWLREAIAALGLGDSLSPSDILREVARDATSRVRGQRARVSIDPSTGLVRTIVLSYAVAGGYHVRVRLTLTGFGAEPATQAPAAAAVGDLRSQLGLLGAP